MQCMVMYSFSYWYFDNLKLNFKFFASKYCVFSATKTNTVETRDSGPIYTAEKFWYGRDKTSSRTKKDGSARVNFVV